MPGWVSGAGLAIKAVTVFPENVASQRPSHQGVITLFDEQDGTPLCVLDAEHITAMRTAGAAAVSARLLARREARALAILGAGVQGRAHLAMLPLVRAFDVIHVASRTRDHAVSLAALDERCVAVSTFAEAARNADVVCCCTDAREPILVRDWVKPGAHVTSVGGTFGPELPRDLVAQARVFVEWRGAAAHAPPAGAHELQGEAADSLTELGEVLTGLRPGRVDDTEITVYKATGTAFEDTVVARMVYDDAVAAGAGTHVDMAGAPAAER